MTTRIPRRRSDDATSTVTTAIPDMTSASRRSTPDDDYEDRPRVAVVPMTVATMTAVVARGGRGRGSDRNPRHNTDDNYDDRADREERLMPAPRSPRT